MLEPKRLRTPLSGWGVGGPLGLAATDGRPEPPTGNRRFWGSGRPGRPGNLTKRWGGEAPQIGPKGRPIGPVCKYCAPGGEGGAVGGRPKSCQNLTVHRHYHISGSKYGKYGGCGRPLGAVRDRRPGNSWAVAVSTESPGCFKRVPGSFKGPRGRLQGPRGPLKGPRGPLKGRGGVPEGPAGRGH